MSQEATPSKQQFDRETLMGMNLASNPIDLSGYDIKEEALRLIRHNTALHRGIVPIALFDGTLVCALSVEGPSHDAWQVLVTIDDIQFLTGCNAHLVPATPQSFAEVMGYYQRQASEDVLPIGNEPPKEALYGPASHRIPWGEQIQYEGALHTSRGVPPGEVSGVKGRKLEGQLLASLEVEDNVLPYLQGYFGVPAVDIKTLKIGIDFPTFPLAIAQGYEMIAIGRDEDGHTRVVMTEPHREEAARILNRVFGEGNWKKLVALQRDIKEAIKNNYADRLRAGASPFNG